MARNARLGLLLVIAAGVGWCSARVSDPPSRSAPNERLRSPSPAVTSNPAPTTVALPASPIAPTETIDSQPIYAPRVLYTRANVRLRAQPSTEALVVHTVPLGSSVRSVELDGQWHRVSFGNYSGWIRGDYLLAERPRAPTANSSTMRPLVGSPSQPRASRRVQSSGRYIRGPRGGCYYINRNGNKTYVDRSMC